jgi:hypothetical protein
MGLIRKEELERKCREELYNIIEIKVKEDVITLVVYKNDELVLGIDRDARFVDAEKILKITHYRDGQSLHQYLFPPTACSNTTPSLVVYAKERGVEIKYSRNVKDVLPESIVALERGESVTLKIAGVYERGENGQHTNKLVDVKIRVL